MIKIFVFTWFMAFLLPSTLIAQQENSVPMRSYIYHLGREIQLIVENSFVIAEQVQDLQNGSEVQKKTLQSWNYRFSGELGLFRRAIILATVMPGFSDQLAFVTMGVGVPFTAPWAIGAAHPYNGFISTISVNYARWCAKHGHGGNLLLEGFAVAVQRQQWNVGKFLTLDAGGAFFPWTRLKRESGAEKTTVLKSPYLSFSLGVGLELHQYFTIILNVEEMTPMRQVDERISFSSMGVTIRTLL